MPPIITNKNTKYGPPHVNTKYTPLEHIQYVAADLPYYSALLINRRNLLLNQNILPRVLTLSTQNWANTITAEHGHLPPLVVISSNRSGWIADGIAAADAQLQALGLAAFNGPNDLRALTALANQRQSPPLYCPSRTEANRNVYIVVHALEYRTYRAALTGRNVTVVGWGFQPPVPANINWTLAGFGPSRFAATQFCKELRVAAGAPWDYAWLLDDNVVALTNFPSAPGPPTLSGYQLVEAAMPGVPAHACVGFRGGSNAEAFTKNRDWARANWNGPVPGQLPVSTPPGIVQQASLWNIAYLTNNQLNFGPIYIASAEDLSFVKYFDWQNIPYFYYGGIGVYKEVTTYDDTPGAQAVNQARQASATRFTNAEGAGVAAALPPPVEVQPTDRADGGVQTLANFIVNRVLPSSTNGVIMASVGNVNVQDDAKCQGVEQITCGALEAGFVSPAAIDAAFRVNGMNAQVVNRRDVP
jgi:hypothetical protein